MKKDLHLTSFFSLVSIPILILAIILLVFIYRLVVHESLQRQVELNNITVTKSLSNSLWEQIKVLELSPQSREGWALNEIYVDVVNKDIYEYLNGTPVIKFKLYNVHGRTIYSTAKEEIGKDSLDDYLIKEVLSTRQPVSMRSHYEEFHSIGGRLTNVKVLATLIPKFETNELVPEYLRKVEGVFEVFTDITQPMKKIEQSLYNFLVVLVFVFSFIYLALYIMVKHADSVISKNKEDLKNKIIEVENINEVLEDNTRELAIARDIANHANVAKSQFLANMSHELRTPLNAILGYSELVAEEIQQYKNEVIEKDLEKIHQAGAHLLELIDGILDLSKIEAGQMELHREAINISHLLEDIKDTVMPLVKKNNNDIKLDLDFDDVILFGDITKIRQILFNLISNAAKFTSNGTITLASRMLKVNNDRKIVFEVADTGIGIAPENIDKLFDPFEQEDISTTRKYGGTGLGLTITKRFCTMMEGEIEVDSEQGKGTKFIVYLPFIEAPTMTQQAV
ncbi:sensor histidine kinase [Kaarinaea lacus]